MCWLCSDRRRAPLVEGCHVRRGAGQDDRAHPFHVRHPFLNLPANRVLPAWLVLVPKRCAVRSSRLTYPSAFPRSARCDGSTRTRAAACTPSACSPSSENSRSGTEVPPYHGRRADRPAVRFLLESLVLKLRLMIGGDHDAQYRERGVAPRHRLDFPLNLFVHEIRIVPHLDLDGQEAGF